MLSKYFKAGCNPKAEPSPARRDLPLHSFLLATLLFSQELGSFWAAPWGRTGPKSGSRRKTYFGYLRMDWITLRSGDSLVT